MSVYWRIRRADGRYYEGGGVWTEYVAYANSWETKPDHINLDCLDSTAKYVRVTVRRKERAK